MKKGDLRGMGFVSKEITMAKSCGNAHCRHRLESAPSDLWKTISMTRTEVTRILRVVFFFWLLVSLALVMITIATLLTSSDAKRRPEIPQRESAVESDFVSFNTRLGAPVPADEFERLIAASLWHAHCIIHSESKTPC